MKLLLTLFFGFSCVVSASQVQVMLNQGSQILGKSNLQKITFETQFGALEVPLQKIHLLQKQEELYKLFLNDGQVLLGKPQLKILRVFSGLGPVKIDVESIQKLEVLDNKKIMMKTNWSTPVNGLSINLSGTTEGSVKLGASRKFTLQIKNVSDKAISFPYPDIKPTTFDNAMDSGFDSNLFSIKLERINSEDLQIQVNQEITDKINQQTVLEPGKILTIEMTAQFTDQNKVESLKQQAHSDEKVVSLKTNLIVEEGEYRLKFVMQKAYHNGARIVADDYEGGIWNGILSTDPVRVKVIR